MTKIIEAGHFYECNGPSNVSMQGWKIGCEQAIGEPDAETAIFIDDYHDRQAFVQDGETFLGNGAAETVAAQADHVFYEKDIAKAAPGKLRELLDGSSVRVRKGVVSAAGVRLGKINEAGGLTAPTCTFLDYVLLCRKANIAPEQVTILPDVYEKQQANLSKVLGKLGVPALSGYTVILFNPDSGNSAKKVAL